MNIAFWFLAAAMIGAAVASVLRPLLRRAAPAQDDSGFRYAAYRAEMSELEGDTESGVIDGAQMEAARADIGRELLQATGTDSEPAQQSRPERRWIASAVIAVLLPAFSLFIYLHIGAPDLAGPGDQADQAHANVEHMVESLRQRLEQQPDDKDGWLMLARSYMVMGKYDAAVQAMERVYKFAGDDPVVLIRYADALSMADGGRIGDKALGMVEKVLKEQPHDANGLMLAGMAAAQRGDTRKAVDYWNRLLPELPGDSQAAAEVRSLIARADKSGTTSTATPGGGSISVHVQLASNLHADPDDTVFVIAKAPNGPPMPLAVVRRKAGELPLDITLDDSSAMSSSAKLSDFSQVDLSARVSKSGDALRKSGDLIGDVTGVKVAAGAPVTITIDHLVP